MGLVHPKYRVAVVQAAPAARDNARMGIGRRDAEASLLRTPSDARARGVSPTECNMRVDSDDEAAKASLVTASPILQSEIERCSGANGSKLGVLANWQKLRFGPFELSIGERVLLRDGRRLPLGDRAFDILTYLANRSGEVVAKQELMDHVWSDVTVGEGSLRVHVAAIRKALRDGQCGNRYIANITGRGYSFVSTVVQLEGGKGSGSNSPNLRGGLAAQPLMPISREAEVS
jgi:DNA-binding winged helix-turn-helix (wHTH) protein